MKNIWFRVGMEATVTDEELVVLKEDSEKAYKLMQNIISRAKLSGETYILGNNDTDINQFGYDNPDEEINFSF